MPVQAPSRSAAAKPVVPFRRTKIAARALVTTGIAAAPIYDTVVAGAGVPSGILVGLGAGALTLAVTGKRFWSLTAKSARLVLSPLKNPAFNFTCAAVASLATPATLASPTLGWGAPVFFAGLASILGINGLIARRSANTVVLGNNKKYSSKADFQGLIKTSGGQTLLAAALAQSPKKLQDRVASLLGQRDYAPIQRLIQLHTMSTDLASRLESSGEKQVNEITSTVLQDFCDLLAETEQSHDSWQGLNGIRALLTRIAQRKMDLNEAMLTDLENTTETLDALQAAAQELDVLIAHYGRNEESNSGLLTELRAQRQEISDASRAIGEALSPEGTPRPEPSSSTDRTTVNGGLQQFSVKIGEGDPVIYVEVAGHAREQGGMGQVIAVREADDEALSRGLTAMKIMLTPSNAPQRELEQMHGRLQREVRNLERLNQDGGHRHLIEYRGSGNLIGGENYFAMEWVEGGNLTGLKRNGEALSLREANRIILQLLSVLKFAHERGAVHRDVKPANILVGQRAGRAEIKLADWGTVKSRDDIVAEVERSEALTRRGAILGTRSFMDPEAVSVGWDKMELKHPGKAHLADLYSVGVVYMYMLLDGRRAPLHIPPFPEPNDSLGRKKDSEMLVQEWKDWIKTTHGIIKDFIDTDPDSLGLPRGVHANICHLIDPNYRTRFQSAELAMEAIRQGHPPKKEPTPATVDLMSQGTPRRAPAATPVQGLAGLDQGTESGLESIELSADDIQPGDLQTVDNIPAVSGPTATALTEITPELVEGLLGDPGGRSTEYMQQFIALYDAFIAANPDSADDAEMVKEMFEDILAETSEG